MRQSSAARLQNRKKFLNFNAAKNAGGAVRPQVNEKTVFNHCECLIKAKKSETDTFRRSGSERERLQIKFIYFKNNDLEVKVTKK